MPKTKKHLSGLDFIISNYNTEFTSSLCSNNCDLNISTETWLNNNISDVSIGVQGYQIIRCDCTWSKCGGGVILYVRNGIDYFLPVFNVEYIAENLSVSHDYRLPSFLGWKLPSCFCNRLFSFCYSICPSFFPKIL